MPPSREIDRTPFRLDERQTREVVRNLRFLADPARLRLLSLLSECPALASELAARMELETAVLWYHLHMLRVAGIIRSDRQGRTFSYSLEEFGWQLIEAVRAQFE